MAASPSIPSRVERSHLTGVERFFDEDEIIVSKTDLKGRITYANLVFQRVAGYSEEELLGRNHNVIRHPHMPRCVFKYLWDTIQAGREVFAYVINRSRNGDHYWVFAHVTPTFDPAGRIVSYHSNRRVPRRDALDKITPVYDLLRRAEAPHRNPQDAWRASLPVLVDFLQQNHVTYDELVFSL